MVGVIDSCREVVRAVSIFILVFECGLVKYFCRITPVTGIRLRMCSHF